jgi:TolB-like protein/Tfp pilus assembly protein PilF
MSSSSTGSFEFRTDKATRIFDHLVKAFELDYVTRHLAHDDSGWRTLGDIANGMRISTSIVYSKSKNQFSPPIQELLQRGLVERRFFQNERGRGGEVMRFRIAYDHEFVKTYFDQEIRRGSGSLSSIKSPTSSSWVSRDHKLDTRRIAVLPFSNISPNANDGYFADGMTEELISTLSKIRGLKVISRISVLRYRQTNKSLSEIARELHVDAVLEGSVRKAADDLRITVQLLDVENDEYLLSQDYDRKFDNVFSLQKEIAQKIADSLQVTILSKESKELGKKPTESMQAYILYLKSGSYRHRFTLDSFRKGIDYCEQAIEKDPKYAQAYASIASMYSTLGFSGMLPMNEAFPKAESFAEKAMQLDPSIPESHLAHSNVLVYQKWDFLGAETEIKCALDLNPNLVECRLSLAHFLMCSGRFNEAVVECHRALELDPLSTSTQGCGTAGAILSGSHRYDEAIPVLKNEMELDPNSALAHHSLGMAQVMKGMIGEGISEIKLAIELSEGKVANWISDLALAYAKTGKINEVRDILADMLKINEQSRRPDTEIAGVYVSLGDKDKAIEWLEKAYSRRAGYLVMINVDSSFDDIRSDPRFQALRKKIGFPDTE